MARRRRTGRPRRKYRCGLMADIRNLSRLLRHVHLSGTVSRADLAERMGLNRSTIMALTAELSAAGLVHEERPSFTGRAGRPSLVVRPSSLRS